MLRIADMPHRVRETSAAHLLSVQCKMPANDLPPVAWDRR
jgi:hypothetical protein